MRGGQVQADLDRWVTLDNSMPRRTRSQAKVEKGPIFMKSWESLAPPRKGNPPREWSGYVKSCDTPEDKKRKKERSKTLDQRKRKSGPEFHPHAYLVA